MPRTIQVWCPDSVVLYLHSRLSDGRIIMNTNVTVAYNSCRKASNFIKALDIL